MIDHAELMSYWPRMVAYARRFMVEADHTDWEDAAAAAIEKAIRHPASLETTASVEGWLMQATRWSALSMREARRRESGHQDVSNRFRARVDAGSSAHVTTLMVREALAGLPAVLRRHADARLEGRSLREVGEALGHTKATAYHHETALKAAMRERLEGRPMPVVVALRPKASPSGKHCTEGECDRPLVARGQCRMHYLRAWRATSEAV